MNFRLEKKNSRRFYCDACGHWVVGNRDDIKNHNGTAMHRKNYERKLKEQHMDARRNKMKLHIASKDEMTIELEKTVGERKKEEKKKKFEERMKRAQEVMKKKKESDSMLMAKSISMRGVGGEGGESIWRIEIDEETGKACFFNTLSGDRKFEKPFGLVLNEEDQEFWDQCKENVSEGLLGYRLERCAHCCRSEYQSRRMGRSQARGLVL